MGLYLVKAFQVFKFCVNVNNVYCQTKGFSHLSIFSVEQELLTQGTLFRYTLTTVGMKFDSIWRYMHMQTLV